MSPTERAQAECQCRATSGNSFNCIVFSKLRAGGAAWSGDNSWDSGGPVPPGWWFSAVLFSLMASTCLKVPARCSRRLLLQNRHFTNYGTDPSQHKPHSQTTQLFSSHISCTPITDLHHNRVRRYLDNESSRTAPVSRDGRISRRKLSPAL